MDYGKIVSWVCEAIQGIHYDILLNFKLFMSDNGPFDVIQCKLQL